MERLIASKKALAVELSRIKGFETPKVRVEQYQTNSDIAADVLWTAYMEGKVSGKTVADLGCGTGILGIGALMLGADKVYFVDIDDEALNEAKKYYENMKSELKEEMGEAEFHNCKVEDLAGEVSAGKVDLVIENPPFGTKEKHADKVFLEKAFGISDNVISFHKSETMRFLEAISKDFGYDIRRKNEYKFPLKKTMEHHKKKVEYIDVVVCFFEKLKR